MRKTTKKQSFAVLLYRVVTARLDLFDLWLKLSAAESGGQWLNSVKVYANMTENEDNCKDFR